MEGSSADGVPQTNGKSENVVESLSDDLSKLQVLDVDDLLTKIEEVYKCIIQQSTNPTSSFRNFFKTPMKDSKSSDEYNKHKKAAEEYWKEENFEEALLHIAQSIAHAENDSAELALAYSDRSYVLFKLGRYNCCIQDVKRATEIKNCRLALKQKLRERKKQCMKNEQSIDTDNEEDRLEWRRSCTLTPSNAFPPNTSTKLKVDFDEKQERYLIAIENIQPGEILSIDDFYVTSLRPSENYTRCSFCLLICDTLIPCSTCTLEMYCSEKCRSSALNLFHQSECKFIKLYDPNIISYKTILAIRMFLIGTDQGKQLNQLMKKLKPHDIFVKKYDHHSRFDDYRSTLQIRRIDQVQNKDVCTAACIIIVLLRSSFFGDNDTLPNRLGPVESYAALLLINHLITLDSRDPKIVMLHIPEYESLEDETALNPHGQTIGYGICSLQSSLIKLSCHANTSSFIQDRQQIVFATRTIRSGEKISTSSAMYKFPQWTKEKRVSSHNFCICEIDANSSNCPKLELLEDVEIRFSSVLDSSIENKMEELDKKVSTAFERSKEFSKKEMLELIIENSNLYCKLFPIPSYDIVLCEQLLLVFMKVLYCDHHRPQARQRQYSDLSLTCYFIDVVHLISYRIISRPSIELDSPD